MPLRSGRDETGCSQQTGATRRIFLRRQLQLRNERPITTMPLPVRKPLRPTGHRADSSHLDKRPRPSAENARKDSNISTLGSGSKSTNATGSGTAASKKNNGGDLMDSFLAPTASTRPNRPVPPKKPVTNDPLAAAFANLAAAQAPVAEPEPTRKSPDPTRAPRTGRDGKPRPHMSVRWKDGPSLTQIRMIEARDPTEVCQLRYFR